ncbi:MAG: hypothetical protein J6K26_05385 [Lachnospiraceae bacterium]|nr:hypothetical protein [Lachnospiraceae bacterium]
MNIYKNQSEMEYKAGMHTDRAYPASAQNVYGKSSVEKHPSAKGTGSYGYNVDFSGGMPGNQAYGEHGKTAEDVMSQAAGTDVALQKDYMLVMASTMSEEDFAELSKEGYDPGQMEPKEMVTIVDEIKAKMAASGTVVTGYNDDLDRELLKEITGSEVQAQEILEAFRKYDIPATKENTEAAKAAIDMAQQLPEITEGMKKYLLENHLTPTIENLYKAAYSGSMDAGVQNRGYFAETTGGYYGRKADQVDVSELQDSMEKVIRDAGYEVTEETLQDAEWMVASGLPLTEESFARLEKINETDVKEAAMAVARALQDGRTAKAADLSSQESLLEQAVRINEEAAAISDQAVDRVVADGEKLDLAHLSEAEQTLQKEQVLQKEQALQGEQATHSGQELQAEQVLEDRINNPVAEGAVMARRQMEEVRLLMSVQVNYHLLKQGISIDTTELSTLVEELKQAEQEIQNVLFGRSDRVEDTAAGERNALLNETLGKVRAIPGMPASVLGELLKEHGTAFSKSVSVNMVYEAGVARQASYEAVSEKYETLMTAPRADYGDSIRKAFRNVDDILQDMNLETTESNRRAVRILGYNSMEITGENIQAVKTAYLSVSRVVEKMTPAAALELIREGSNPLHLSMEELESRLEKRESSPEEEMEKYSRYLYRLEQNHEITAEEKESYIGIYRLLHQIEKRDGAAIGSLLQQGAEINFKNLLTAVRSHNKGRMDVTVDDGFGALEERFGGYEYSISSAIETAYHSEEQQSGETFREQENAAGQKEESEYYRRLAGDIKSGLTPKGASEILEDSETGLEAFYDKQRASAMDMSGTDSGRKLIEAESSQEMEQADAGYRREQAAEIRAAAEVSEKAVSLLMEYDIPLTLDHLAAADSLLSERGNLAKQVKKQAQYLEEQAVFGRSVSGSVQDGEKSSAQGTAADSISSLLEKAMEDMQEHFTDRVSAQEVYGQLADRMEEVLSLSAERQTDRIDLKEIHLAWKQISVTRKLAGEENYEIPMEIGGSMTSVNVRFLHGDTHENHVTINMETETTGKISALFESVAGTSVDQDSASGVIAGYVICNRQEGLAALKEREGAFRDKMQEQGIAVSEIKFIYSEHADINNFAGKADEINRTGMSSAKLYETAKTFMKTFL